VRPAWGTAPHLVRLAGLSLLTVWLVVLSWSALSEGFPNVSIPLLMIGAVVVAIGVAARVLRMPALLVPVLQALVGAWLLVGATTDSLAPTGANLEAFRTALRGALESAGQYAAPVGTDVPPVHPLLLGGGLLVLLVVDLVVVGLRRVVLAALPLVGAYSLAPLVTGLSVSWLLFAAAGASYLALLYVESSERTSRWGHGVADERSGFSVRNGGVGSTASALGASALALGVVLPLAVPTLELSFFEGNGPGTRDVQVKNPMVDLRRDLRRGENIPLLQVTTNDPDPSYLRLSVLTRFVDGRWTPGDREIPSNQAANGEMPGLDGVSTSLDRREFQYAIDAEPTFDSTWLPAMAQTTQIQAGTDWRYDLNTRDFIVARNDVTTAGRDWSFRAVELEYDPESMARATSGAAAVRAIFTEVPPSVSNEVRRLAASVTADAPTRYQKAQVLQQWFRQDGGFRYDIRAADSAADDDLEAFLDAETGRVGYCEQFAASMAIMARVLGIPSRVAVGFLDPRRVDRDTWQYRAWDLHAWPELYFPGSGWVRFEPTPGDRAAEVPGYTTAEVADLSAAPTPSATRSSELLPERGGTDETPEANAAEDEGSSVVVPVLLGLLALAVIALVVTAPRLLRGRRRRQRLESGPEGVWDELRASVLDLGHRWPEGRSPRRTARQVGSWLAAPVDTGQRPDRPRRGREHAPEAAAALDRLVQVMERSRYSRAGAADGVAGMQEDLLLVEESLRAGVSPRVERRSRWLPRSLAPARRTRSQEASAQQGVAADRSRVDELVG
jgi:transglutaminase-like putative cysteine protease